MHSFAQTNIQLFNQLHHDGYSSTDLLSVLNTYKIAMRLFTGCFRPSGKTFIAHLVGTASILSSLRAPAKVVAAGLIHAAYANGNFGEGGEGISDTKREQVRRSVGKEVEEYVARYTALQWNTQTIPAIRDRLDKLGPLDRDVLLIRLANELEENLDFGILYCGDVKHQQYINHNSRFIVEMAEKLGFSTLAIELEKVFRETAVAEIPMELRNQSGQNSSFLIVPNSYRRRLSAAFSDWLISKLRHLQAVIAVDLVICVLLLTSFH